MDQAKNNPKIKLINKNWITRSLKITIKIFQKLIIRMTYLIKA